MKRHNRTRTRLAPTARHARTLLPSVLHTTLTHLAVDLNVSLSELLVEGGVLLCRYHGRARGLRAPMPPLGKAEPEVIAELTGGGR